MHGPFLLAVLAGLGGMLGWGLADFFAKKTIDLIGDVQTLLLAHLFGAGAYLLVVAIRAAASHSVSLPIDLPTWLGLAFFGTLQAAVYLLVYRGFGKGQLAVLNPIFASFSGLTALLSIFAFGEVVSGHMALALALLFAGILLINLDVGAQREAQLRFARVPGFPEVAAATLLAAVWTILWDRFVHGHDWLVYAAGMYVFMTLALVAYVLVRRVRVPMPKGSVWIWLALIGLCETGAYLAISLGYGATPHVSVVALLSGAFSLPTIFLARVFLKERTTGLQAVASLIILVGIVLLNLR